MYIGSFMPGLGITAWAFELRIWRLGFEGCQKTYVPPEWQVGSYDPENPRRDGFKVQGLCLLPALTSFVGCRHEKHAKDGPACAKLSDVRL